MTPDELAGLASLLAAGFDPAPPGLRAVVDHRVPGTLLADGGRVPGPLASLVESWIDRLTRIPEVRVVGEAARRAGIPYSEARARWSDPDDIAFELAIDAVRAAESLASCPNCGVDPDDVVEADPPHRELPLGRWKLQWGTCHACARRYPAEEELADPERKYRRDGAFLRWMPREPGDPFEDRLA